MKCSSYLNGIGCARGAASSACCTNAGSEVVHAAVAVRGDVTELELIQFCRGELDDFKVPRRVELHDELPRLPSGKIDRHAFA